MMTKKHIYSNDSRRFSYYL